MKKILSTILAFAISLQMLQILSFAAHETRYNGQTIAVINTDVNRIGSFSGYINENSSSGLTETASNTNHDINSKGDSNEFNDMVIDDITPMTNEEIEVLKNQTKNRTVSAGITEYKIGDKKTLEEDITVQCVYVGENCTVWNQINNDESECITDSECVNAGKWIDKMIPKELDLFGDKRIDTDNDGKIAVFFHEMEEGGFIRYSDYVDTDMKIENIYMYYRSSINCDCVHISRTNSYNYSLSVFVHEYQHYIHFSYGYVDKTLLTYFDYIPSVSEGFSTSAEYILNNFCRYLYGELDEYSLFSFDNDPYELMFYFFQYIRTRYAQLTNDNSSSFPGKNVYKTILEKMTVYENDGFRIAADLLYPENEYPNLKNTDDRLKQLVVDFWITIFEQNDSGINSFFNENNLYKYIEVDFSDMSNAQDRHINPGMAKCYLLNDFEEGSAVITGKSSNNIVIVALNSPYKAIWRDLNDGTGKHFELYFKDKYWYSPATDVTEFPNKSLLYWNINKTEVYRNEAIKLSDNTTAYAVTEPAEEITCGTYEIDPNEYYTKCFSFTPETSGYYMMENSNGRFIVTAEDNTECCFSSYEHIYGDNNYYNTVYLLKDKKYYISVDSTAYDELTDIDEFSLSLSQSADYTLTLDFGDDIDKAPIKYSGLDTYYVDYCWDLVDTINYQKVLIGWSKDKNALNSDYYTDSLIKISGNQTLYAVYFDLAKIELGENKDLEEYIYCFIAPNDGYYYFNSSAYACCLDENGNIVENTELYERNSIHLSKGQTCIFYLEDFEISIEYSQKNQNYSISYYCLYTENENASFITEDFCFYCTGGDIQTITSHKPIGLKPFSKFIGWSENMDAIEATYFPGDEIQLECDIILYPVFSESNSILADSRILTFLREILITYNKSLLLYRIFILSAYESYVLFV